MKKLAKLLFVFSDMFSLLFALCSIAGIWLIFNADDESLTPLWLMVSLCISVLIGSSLLLLRKALGLFFVLLPSFFWLQDEMKFNIGLTYIGFVSFMMVLPYLLTFADSYQQRKEV